MQIVIIVFTRGYTCIYDNYCMTLCARYFVILVRATLCILYYYDVTRRIVRFSKIYNFKIEAIIFSSTIVPSENYRRHRVCNDCCYIIRSGASLNVHNIMGILSSNCVIYYNSDSRKWSRPRGHTRSCLRGYRPTRRNREKIIRIRYILKIYKIY